MNDKIICTACGTQYASSDMNRECPICLDDRQSVPESGQSWTTLSYLQEHYSVIIRKLREHLYELKMAPSFAIGQRAFLVIHPEGNVLWDCIALLNEPVIAFIRNLGGLKAIAFSHPHYYTTMNEWAEVFNCPVYIHGKDGEWIFNRGPFINTWEEEVMPLWGGMELMNIGGHFPGSTLLRVPFLTKEGTLLCGDTFYISPGRKHAAVMYSYPNRIPLPVAEVKRIKDKMSTIGFDALYGFYDYQNITEGAWSLIQHSLDRYQ